MLSSRFYDAQKFRGSREFRFNNLNGLNNKGRGQSKIQIFGHLDPFTRKTLYENYDAISHNLQVYPTIRIYPRGYELEGGFSGFYHSSDNHIDMIDHYYLISILSHEMRHAFQYIYFPDLYMKSEYNSSRGYLDSWVERDARGYSLDYCTARKYWEEADHCKEEEEENELVIQAKLSPSQVGLDDDYFRKNPTKAKIVPRNYHWGQTPRRETQTVSAPKNDSSDVKGCLVGLAKLAFIILIIYAIAKS